MKILPASIIRVQESFQKLPGIGPKSAQRLALYLLLVPQAELDNFAQSIKNLKINTKYCRHCKNVTESDPCPVCADPQRDPTVICVVETPSDVVALEKTGRYHGLYHVLHGRLDPLNNIGPDEIFINELINRIKAPNSRVSEVILATNPNMEGEATSLYLHKQLMAISNTGQLTITRLAHGLPVGADIEYADEVTLSRALDGRKGF